MKMLLLLLHCICMTMVVAGGEVTDVLLESVLNQKLGLMDWLLQTD